MSGMPLTVWVVDDDDAVRWVLDKALQAAGISTRSFDGAEKFFAALGEERPDVVVTDVRMPGVDGMGLMRRLEASGLRLPVIVITAHTDLDSAVAAYRGGAFEYLPKPFDVDEAVALVWRAARSVNHAASVQPAEGAVMPQMIGQAPAMQEVFRTIGRLSRSSMNVLITGESGTGKELVARALHRFSRHPEGPFVAVNCGALPDTLLESELFGHVRGAFTDARRDHRGAIPRADGGTLFLDEIGDISPAFQVKLLRFLQDGRVRPLGAETETEVQVRVLAATHRNLPEAIRAGRFREDLYFRLAAYEIHLPPLRDRLEDLPLLVDHFRRQLAAELGIPPPPPASPEVLAVLARHRWPGNVRELALLLRRCLIDCRTLADPGEVQRLLTDGAHPSASTPPPEPPAPSLSSLVEAERQHILAVLAATGGNRSAAARILGIERKTLTRKLRALGIERASTPAGRNAP